MITYLSKKRISSYCVLSLVIITIAILFNVFLFAEKANTASADTESVEEIYYKSLGYEPIYNLKDLHEQTYSFSAAPFDGAKGLILMNDIDCASDISWHEVVTDWETNGYTPRYLYTLLDGNGHEIKNGDALNVSYLFAGVGKSREYDSGVRNLFLDSISLAGAVSTEIMNVHVRGNLLSSGIGQEVDFREEVTITNCSVEATITAAAFRYVQGYPGGGYVTVTNIGGLLGSGIGQIKNSYFAGNIIFDFMNTDSVVGGLVGDFYGGSIENCYSNNGFTFENRADGKGVVGTLSGTISNDVSVVNSYAGISPDGIPESNEYISEGTSTVDFAGVTSIPRALFGVKNYVSMLDFEKTWNLGETDNYPTLRTLAVEVIDCTQYDDENDGGLKNSDFTVTYERRYYNAGEEFSLTYDVTDRFQLIKLLADGNDVAIKLSERTLTFAVTEETTVAIQAGYKHGLSLPKKEVDFEVNGISVSPDGLGTHISMWIDGTAIRIKVTAKDGYVLKKVSFSDGADITELGNGEYILNAPYAATKSEQKSYTVNVVVEPIKDGPNTELIIIIAVVAIALICGAMLVVYFMKRRKRGT
jgi:hypothetical protein